MYIKPGETRQLFSKREADTNVFMFLKYTNERTFFSLALIWMSPHVRMILACGETNPICQTRGGNKTRELYGTRHVFAKRERV